MDGNKTSLNLDENIEGLLCYAAGWVTGIIFLVLDKNNKFVKFHAIQSIIVFGAISVLQILNSVIISNLPIIGGLLSLLIGFAIFPLWIILWIVLMVKAYQHQMFKLPVVGDIAEEQANK